jgi:hypothetical protein
MLDAVVDIGVEADAPLPTEFRLLRAGLNLSRHNPIVFDAAAAARVMSETSVWGVDLMIDLEHDSLDPRARVARNNAADAMGWFRLAVRDGELWAVGVTWTPEGERRLRDRLQRYISIACKREKDGSPSWVVNVALCSMPAMHDAPPLVAASIAAYAATEYSMDPKLITEALDALIAGDAAKCMEILKGVIASAAGAEAPADEPAAADASAESPDAPPDPNFVAASALRRITGREDTTEAIAELRRMRDTVASLSAERDAEVLTERRGLVGDLVRLGVEYPATAWDGDAELRNPVRRLAEEPIGELRARVATYTALRPDTHARPVPPVTGTDSEYERRLTAGMTDDQRAAYVALRATRRAQ